MTNLPVGEPEGTLGGRFVAASLVFAVLVTGALCLGLPAWAGRVASDVTPAGAITAGRASLQPQPGWERSVPDSPGGGPIDNQVLVKDGVVLQLGSTSADAGADPAAYLDAMVTDFDAMLVPDTEAVTFTTPTGDSGAAFTVTGSDQSGMFAAVVARDGSEVALVGAVGDPVAASALLPEIADMVTGIRFRKARS